jgi:hypothetical protein
MLRASVASTRFVATWSATRRYMRRGASPIRATAGDDLPPPPDVATLADMARIHVSEDEVMILS